MKLSWNHVCCVWVVVLISLGSVGAQDNRDNILEAYSLGDTPYTDIKATLDAVKSKTGTINYVKSANKVFVFDTPAVHKMVKQILAKSRKPAVNISVDIEFQNMQMIRDRGLKVGGAIVASKTSGRATIRGHVNVDARDQTATIENNNSMSLMVSSGRTGELWSTKDVLDSAALKRYGLEPWQAKVVNDSGTLNDAGFPKEFVRAVGTHMWIQPTYMPNGLVQVDIFPVVRAETSDGTERYFKVSRVRTLVTVKPGQKLFVGGTSNAMRTFFRDLFNVGASSKTTTDSLSIYLTAHVRIMDPSNPESSRPVRPNRDGMWKHFPDK